MAHTSGFFDAIDQGSGNYDRVYSAANFAHYFSLLVQNGVFPNPSTGMQVKASASPDMHVSVQSGSGWVNGYYITVSDSSPEQLTIPTANPSLSRIDSVIMGLNYVQREIQLYIKSGAVSASPSAVSLQRDNDLYELELAQITVSAGMASITQASITDMRSNTSRCGIVKGMVDQIDTTDLFAQYDAAFQTWFADIKSQLSGNVATNLQNQINTLKTEKADTTVTDALQEQINTKASSNTVTALSDTVLEHTIRLKELTDIEHGLQNPLDIGGVFLLADTYSKTIKDALPCKGGAFDTVTYADLFSITGFAYGASLPNTVKRTVQDTCSNACIDPVTGYLYVAVITGTSSNAACTVYVYDNNGSLLRNTVVKNGYSRSVLYLVAYNNTVAITVLDTDRYNHYSVSLDGGLTWSTYTKSKIRSAATCSPCVTDTSVTFFYADGTAGGALISVFTKSTQTWDHKVAISGSYTPIFFATVGPGTIGYANFNGTIYKSTFPGSWTSTGITVSLSNVPPITPILNEKFYFAYDATTIKEVTVSTGVVTATYAVSGITLTCISGAAVIGGVLVLFDSDVPDKAIAIYKGAAQVADLLPNNTQPLTTVFTVPSGEVQAIKKSKGETLLLSPLRFNLPSVPLTGLTAYMRTKKHTGV